MKKVIKLLSVLIILSSNLTAQEKSMKEKAMSEFKKEHYNKAIELMEKAKKEHPKDAEIYYYLGFFNHYRAYDSRPLAGYDFSHSQKIFQYLDKAIELDPNHGNAKYFYGAECSANAFNSLQDYELDSLKYFYRRAYEKGAYPEWLLEFGRNMLNSCDKNAILFTVGNPDHDVCSYLQLHENVRTDITVLSTFYTNRPWYVKFLKNGLEGGVRDLTINLTDKQIMRIHNFKWDTTTVNIPLSQQIRKRYDLQGDFNMKWTVAPDLQSNRKHKKIENEKIKKRVYLSVRRAMILQIVEDNYNKRPIYFSNFKDSFIYAGLDKFFRDCGFVSKVLPFKTKNTEYSHNYNKIQQLIKKDRIKDYSTIKETDIPRISGIATYGYSRAFLKLAEHYKNQDKSKKLDELIHRYKIYIGIGFKQEKENYYLNELEKLKN
ncbi:MAG: hypothetical protein K9I68_06085 [Bacteroidales bacterium]|nr:hypothetical protein [Bacteroidales bacterium]MCF8336717.1 hypothetical protein [Bacteroidales bacterium]